MEGFLVEGIVGSDAGGPTLASESEVNMHGAVRIVALNVWNVDLDR